MNIFGCMKNDVVLFISSATMKRKCDRFYFIFSLSKERKKRSRNTKMMTTKKEAFAVQALTAI